MLFCARIGAMYKPKKNKVILYFGNKLFGTDKFKYSIFQQRHGFKNLF